MTLKPGERLRGRAGQRQRQRRLARSNYLCEHCLELGRTVQADVVDHILPLAKGGLDVDENTRNLCHDCHEVVTAEQFGFATVGRGVDRSGRPTFARHAWNSGSRP